LPREEFVNPVILPVPLSRPFFDLSKLPFFVVGAWGNTPEFRHNWGVAPATRMSTKFCKLL
jgi:hypothetical protein